MRKKIVTIVLASAAFAGHWAFAQTLAKVPSGDICSVRPDLCDDQVESAPVARQGQTFNAQPAPRCRMPGSSMSLAQKNLPICQVHVANRAPDAVASTPSTHDILWDDPAPVVKKVTRKPASASASVSFADYMNANASHPALNAKIKDHQKAFAESTGAAVYNFPVNDSSTREDNTNLIVNAPVSGAGPGGTPAGTQGTNAEAPPAPNSPLR